MFKYRERGGLYPFEFVLPPSGLSRDEWKAGWQRLDEAEIWCTEQFGLTDNGRWYCEDGIMTIYFKHETDAFVFRLRWC